MNRNIFKWNLIANTCRRKQNYQRNAENSKTCVECEAELTFKVNVVASISTLLLSRHTNGAIGLELYMMTTHTFLKWYINNATCCCSISVSL